MTIWQFAEISPDPDLHCVIGACPYCATAMHPIHRTDRRHLEWEFDFADIRESIFLCDGCGYWCYLCDEESPLSEENDFDYVYLRSATVPCLRRLDLTVPVVALDEVRDYLMARYEARFDLHPRTMEETVGSVFRDHGFGVAVTGYTADGGIDVVLYDGSRQIGVQVKRYAQRVGVEAIRAFAGSLILAGHSHGIFVTTSSYTRALTGLNGFGLVRRSEGSTIVLGSCWHSP